VGVGAGAAATATSGVDWNTTWIFSCLTA